MAESVAKYQRYDEYKESGVEWLGEIPKDWKVTALKRYCNVKGGYAFASDTFSNVGEPVIRIGDIKADGSISLESCKFISTELAKNSHAYLVEKGQLLMAMTGATIGKAGVYINDSPAYLNQRVGKFVIDNDELNYNFLWYTLKTNGYQEYIKLTAFGGAQPNISDTGMVDYISCFPPLEEQTQIANFLDFETTQIDTLIDKQQTLIQLLKEKRQAAISHAVTPYKNEKSAKLGYFIDLLSGYSFPSNGYQTEPEGNTALLRGINVGVGVLKWDETVWWSRTNRDGLDAFELEEGDIVFGMDRPWISAGARVAEVTKEDLPCLLLQRVIRIRANKDTYQPFIKLCLASKEFKFSVEADLTGVSVPHISPDQVKSFLIRDVGYEQQKLITDDAFEKMKVLDLIEDSAEQAIQLMQERRTALISAAVTGKIDVRGWRAADIEAL